VRLLVVTQYFWPEVFRINDMVAELTARGHQVTVLTGKPNYPDGEIFPEFHHNPKAFSHHAGVDVVRLPMLPRGTGSARLALNYLSFAVSGMILAPFKLAHRRFDAIFVYLPSPVTAALPAVVLRWLRGVPSILWVLDLWPDSLRAVGAVKSERVLAIVGRLVRTIYRHSDMVLGQSRSFVHQIGRYQPDPARVGYFPGWAEPQLGMEIAEPAPEVPPRPGYFTIMFAGNIGEAQDFPAVLAAADRLRERPVRWVIVGDGRKAEWVRAEIARLGLEDRVVLPGRFPLERMGSFYHCADALLVSLGADPTFSMTIPAKVQTYLMAGRPILAMLDGEGAAVVRDAAAGYAVAAGDAAGLADAVRQMMSASPVERQAMAERGKAYAAREFDRAGLITRLEEIVADLGRQK